MHYSFFSFIKPNTKIRFPYPLHVFHQYFPPNHHYPSKIEGYNFILGLDSIW